MNNNNFYSEFAIQFYHRNKKIYRTLTFFDIFISTKKNDINILSYIIHPLAKISKFDDKMFIQFDFNEYGVNEIYDYFCNENFFDRNFKKANITNQGGEYKLIKFESTDDDYLYKDSIVEIDAKYED